jgi:hypothetical protein
MDPFSGWEDCDLIDPVDASESDLSILELALLPCLDIACSSRSCDATHSL